MTPQQIEILERLANLKAQGALSAAEFEKQKAILLGQPQSEQKENAPATPDIAGISPEFGKGCAIFAVVGFLALIVGISAQSLGNNGGNAPASASLPEASLMDIIVTLKQNGQKDFSDVRHERKGDGKYAVWVSYGPGTPETAYLVWPGLNKIVGPLAPNDPLLSE